MIGNGNKNQVPYLQQVSEGYHDCCDIYRKIGIIDLLTKDVESTVWEFGTTTNAQKYTFSSVADIDTISSSDSGDTQLVTIIGLDIDGNEVIQSKNLDGQNKVTLDTPLWRVNEFYNDNGTEFVGNIYCYVDTAISLGVPTDATKVRSYISAGRKRALQLVYTSPKNETDLFLGLEASLTKGLGATVVAVNFQGQIREQGSVWDVVDEFNLNNEGNSSKNITLSAPLKFEPLTDFCGCVTASATGIGCSWTFMLQRKKD